MGMPILSLPALSHPDGSGNGGTGFLVPDMRYRINNGLELVSPFYIRFSPTRDLTLTPHVYSSVLPMLGTVYRQLTSTGAFRTTSNITYSTRQTVPLAGPSRSIKDVRGNFEASGKFQLSPYWNISGSGRVTTDKTFLQRYYISGDDRLRSMVRAERVGPTSYLSIAGWAVQDLRPGSIQGNQPVALPLIDYRLRLADPVLSGAIEFQANSLSLVRTAGQDTQRAFASIKWEKRTLTPMGQELSLTTYGRADVYNANDTLDTNIAIYRGNEGWSSRFIGAVAADMRWPLLGPALGGTQLITPRVQIAASPNTKNLGIPNEDSRAIELEDSNLFALNRFPGYDRWEDGTRITYGAEYGLNLPRFSLRSVVGQSYRLNKRPQLFPDGTGLSGRLSDVVGRTTLAYGNYVKFTHRFRLDKNSFSIRRNEFDATFGTKRTYAMVGYLRLNRNIDASIEDLRDREELRLGVRVALDRYWSVYGSSVIDLTGKSEDPTTKMDGYQPLRNAAGIAYEDECFIFSATWRHDRAGLGDARVGNSVSFRLAFKNLGR
jgi:LPS-assembly protein